MDYTITKNPQFNSLEIAFNGKPSAEIRQALKDLHFRWHNVKKVWYGFSDENTLTAALNGKPAQIPEVCKRSALDKTVLETEYRKVWNSERMVNYCVGEVAAVANLPSGEIVTVGKRKIETRFCFGESGYDADEARDMAATARTSKEYFKAENMRDINGIVQKLRDQLDGKNDNHYFAAINIHQYIGQPEDYKLRTLTFARTCDIIEAMGGSCYLSEIPGTVVDGMRILTEEELKIVLAVYEEVAKAHEKKVDAYLKRYGTSKVHSWTYWRDA